LFSTVCSWKIFCDCQPVALSCDNAIAARPIGRRMQRLKVTRPSMKPTWNPNKMNRKARVNSNRGATDEQGNQAATKRKNVTANVGRQFGNR
jgi:hypothetical protein